MRNCFSIDLTQTAAKDVSQDVGRLRIEDGKIYRLCRNKTATILVKGDVVFHGTNDTAFKEVYLMGQTSMGTSLAFMAGVALGAVPVDDYFWVQVWGPNDNINTLGHASSAVGVTMIGVSGQTYVTFSVAAGTAGLYGRTILALEAWTTTSAALKKGLIRCL